MKMKTQFSRTVLFLVFTFALFLPTTAAEGKYSGGTGEPNDPYLIATPEDMNAIGADSNDWDKHFLLVNDIDLCGYTDTQFNIIGNHPLKTFRGAFDGKRHTIKNFTWSSPEYGRAIGLFGIVGSEGQIQNLRIENVYIEAENSNHIAGVSGENFGTVLNCCSTGVISGDVYIGGIVGSNAGVISSCYSKCNVSGMIVGGITGQNDGTIKNCYSSSNVSGSQLGGLVGRNYDTIINCYSNGFVDGNSYIGGLCGIGRSVVNCFWDTQTSGQLVSAGGTGLNTEQMKMASSFLKWNACEQIWTIDDGNDYPRLFWEEASGRLIISDKLSDFLKGTGTNNDPYQIYSAREFNFIGLYTCEWDKNFELIRDLDLSCIGGMEFNVIGVGRSCSFTGSFDGKGHTIKNFVSNSQSINCLGLFGYLGQGGKLKSLGVKDVNIMAVSAGGLVGRNDGEIECCYSMGQIIGEKLVGGLVSENSRGSIKNCYSKVIVKSNGYSGGLVGSNYSGQISDCYSMGLVSGTGFGLGGLIGGNIYGGQIKSVTNSFWDVQTSNRALSAGGTSRITLEMQTKSTFTDAGWDFNTPIWNIDEGNDYPCLAWELAPDAPYLQPEPEFTLGMSNTIYWAAVEDANGYLAECAEDANFTTVIADSGWIADTNCTFEGLETGCTYFYRVKAINESGIESEWSNVESSTQVTLAEAVEETLDVNSLVNENMYGALSNKIDVVMNMIEAGQYQQAINKLENDVLQKTDGCALTGSPDKNDWITTCEQQGLIYPLIIEMIEYLEGLI
jgi:hypothetical protein